MNFWAFRKKDAKEYSQKLAKRLQKFCARGETPKRERDKGILWGKGQVELEVDEMRTCRGTINAYKLEKSDNGVSVTLHLYWCANKVITFQKTAIWMLKIKTWTWESISKRYELKIVIEKFYQDKGKAKHLFFTTIGGEKGFFVQRNDPNYVHYRRKKIHDPALIRKKV